MYHHVFVAGTFDGIHKGHEQLLATAFAQGEHVTVGITPDSFVAEVKKKSAVPFENRKQNIREWIANKGWAEKASIIPIIDAYEPAASDGTLDAIVVTSQNKTTGEEINERRKKSGLAELALIQSPLVAAEDGKTISSTRIAAGEIDASGKLTMPETLREELAKPMGRLLTGNEIAETIAKQKGRIIVTVGDVVTQTFLGNGVTPTLSIFDLKVGRQPDESLAQFGGMGTKITSGPGFIAKAAIAAIATWAEGAVNDQSPKTLVIDGEEDLLVLPVILAAPVTTLVYYGQPNSGMVEVEVTIEKKKEMTELFKQFT